VGPNGNAVAASRWDRRIAHWRHNVSSPCAPFFYILSPNWPLSLKFLRRQKNLLPTTAVNQRHPGFGRFSPGPFERRFASSFFLERSFTLAAQRALSKKKNGMSSHSPRRGERPRSSCLAAVVVVVAQVYFFSNSLCGDKNKESDALIRKRPPRPPVIKPPRPHLPQLSNHPEAKSPDLPAARSGPRCVPRFLALRAGYENLTAPLFALSP
jgi:hypothetical protein